MAQTGTAEQEAAKARLLATGKYETYTNAAGKTALRLKKEYQTNPTPEPAPAQTAVKPEVVVPSYTPSRSSLRSAEELASMFGGITYDEAAIRAKFDAATRAEYNLRRKEYDATANKFYGQMYGTQATALDTIRKNNAAAVATGASRGIQAANELSAILGLQETNTQTASELARQRNLLADQEGAAFAKNIVDAMTTSNAVKQALGNLAANLYASDTQYDVGAMQYYAALNQAAQALQGTIYNADRNFDASKYTSDQNLAGVQYNADKNVEAAGVTAKGNVDAANAAGSWNLKAADKTGYWNNQAAATAGQYNVQAAQANNAAQAAYYEYMKTQGAGGQNDYIAAMNYLNEQYNAAMKSGDISSAARWLSQMTGMDYNEALKTVKQVRAEADKALSKKAKEDARSETAATAKANLEKDPIVKFGRSAANAVTNMPIVDVFKNMFDPTIEREYMTIERLKRLFSQ
jgi:hypothetical protein